MRAHDQSSIISTGRKFHPDYGLLLELHALTLVARFYALLLLTIAMTSQLAKTVCVLYLVEGMSDLNLSQSVIVIKFLNENKQDLVRDKMEGRRS